MPHPESWATHPICDPCWVDKNPDREPVRLKGEDPDGEMCCFCGAATTSGIYIRETNLPEYCPNRGVTT